MPTFDAETTEINAFEVEDTNLYIFSQYFDTEEIFAELREYYDSDHYRFEIPADEIERVEAFLNEYFYDLTRVPPDAIEPFCVVKEKYTDHADILRNSVYHTSRGSSTVFVMQVGCRPSRRSSTARHGLPMRTPAFSCNWRFQPDITESLLSQPESVL
jgi:hypothetical protein